MKKTLLCAGSLVLASCASQPGPEIVTVDEDNELGVTMLELDWSGNQADRVLELHGLDAAGGVRASMRLHIGLIPDLPAIALGDGGSYGAEIAFDVAGIESRWLSRETRVLELGTIIVPVTQRFLEIPTVTSVLAREANIIVSHATPGDLAYTTQTCPSNQLLTSPQAVQCCYGNLGTSTVTVFVRTSDNVVVQRTKNPHGTACKASDGLGSCLGAACTYGPFAYAVASFQTVPPGSPYIKIYDNAGQCWRSFWSSPQTHVFSDVFGTNARGQGCPGGASGASKWDY